MAEEDTTEPAPHVEERVIVPPFIDRAPRVLLRAERRIAIMPPILGLGLGIGASYLCFLLGPPDGMLAKTFDPNQLHALIPYAIFCMFFWSLMICLSRLRRLRALGKVSQPALLARAVVRLEGEDGVESLGEALQYPNCLASPLLRRLSVILQQWTLAPGLQDAEIVLANQVALDSDASHRGYSLVRVMIWALPVLGLIGTVLGIADAVGGFANFLGKDINEVSAIRVKLVEVTGGLSFAFLITLEGLLTSLITMLLASTLQSSEERLLARIQRGIVEEFLPALQKAAPAPGPQSGGGEGWIVDLREAVQAALKAITRAADQAVHQIAVAGDGCLASIRGTAEASASAVQVMAEQAGASIAGTAQSATQHMAQVAEASNVAVTAAAQHCLATIGEAAQSAVGEIRTQREAHAREVEALLTRTAQFLTSMAEGLNTGAAAQTSAARDMHETATKVADAVARTSAIQASLADAMKRTEALKVSGTLDGLRAAIDGLGPILTRFQQPFVLQAVPAPRG